MNERKGAEFRVGGRWGMLKEKWQDELYKRDTDIKISDLLQET